MKLLDAEKVKKEKDKAEEDLRRRIKKLTDEEIESTKRLNKVIEEEEKEKKRIAEDLTIVRDAAAAEIKKSVLLAEIKALEERKQEALKPISDLRNEAQRQLDNAKQSNLDAQSNRARTEQLREIFEDKVDALGEQESSLLEKDRELNKREAGIKSAEDEVSRSTESLSKQWVEYHKESRMFLAAIEVREIKVNVEAKANSILKALLEKKEAELMQPIEILYSELNKSIEDNRILLISLNRRESELDGNEKSLVVH